MNILDEINRKLDEALKRLDAAQATPMAAAAQSKIDPNKILYTDKETALMLSIGVRSVHRLVDLGFLNKQNHGTSIRFHRDEINRVAKNMPDAHRLLEAQTRKASRKK